MKNVEEFYTRLVDQLADCESSTIIEYLYLVILLQNYIILEQENSVL